MDYEWMQLVERITMFTDAMLLPTAEIAAWTNSPALSQNVMWDAAVSHGLTLQLQASASTYNAHQLQWSMHNQFCSSVHKLFSKCERHLSASVFVDALRPLMFKQRAAHEQQQRTGTTA